MRKLQLPEGEKIDLELGEEHYLQWTSDGSGGRLGAIIYHPWPEAKPDPENWTPWCCCGIWFREPNIGWPKPIWTLQGEADEHLTLSPSIQCSCGDHGFIRDGKWVRA